MSTTNAFDFNSINCPEGYKAIVAKGYHGEQPEGWVCDWWREKEWDAFHKRVEELKKAGLYGQEFTSVLYIKEHDGFPSSTSGLIIDVNNIEKHTFKPMELKELTL